MNEFMELFISLAAENPLRLSIEHIKTGIPRWRISISGRDMAILGGSRTDAEILFAEDPSRQQAFEDALERLKKREDKLRSGKPWGK